MQQPSSETVEEEAPKPKKSAAKKSAKSAPAPKVVDITDALKDRLTELRRRGYNRLYQPSALEQDKPGNCADRDR